MKMSIGLVGRKIGMTRIFADNGDSQPVTVIDVSNNRVTQIKLEQTDGYSAIQLAYGTKKANRVNKSIAGHFSKAGAEAGSVLKEFRVNTEEEINQFTAGQVLKPDLFQAGQKVDVSGVTIGKGYAGTIKRHNFTANRASHGNSKAHRKPGSTGMAQDPGRVFPGKRMSGRMGGVKRTTQNLEILKIDDSRNLLLIKGAIPGSKGGNVIIRPSIKFKVT